LISICGFCPQEKLRSLTLSEMSSICSIIGATSSKLIDFGLSPEEKLKRW
jgi:hypothetical protein